MRHPASGWLRMRTAKPEIRTVEVHPPSQSDEGAFAFLAAVFVVLCVIYVVAFERYGAGPNTARRTAPSLPYQVLFRDLPTAQQRQFRQMEEGLGEAMAVRARGGEWPAVDALATDGIPPFAPDALDKTGLRWRLLRDGLVALYVGTPTAGGAPAWMIRVQEPDPLAAEQASANAPVDEEHRALPDGRLLHVTFWTRRNAVASAAIPADPALAGWSQIRIKSPFDLEESP